MDLGYDTLDPAVFRLELTHYCADARPVAGKRYKLRIRAAYVWLKSGDTNRRNGPWAYSQPITYTPELTE